MDSIRHGKLPNKLFHVTIPTTMTYSQEELQLYGLPLTVVNNDYLERDFSGTSNVMLPLDKIIDIYSMGAPITIRSDEEMLEVYEILEAYLDDKHNTNTNSIHKPIFKEDRLAEIDRFASEIFRLNKHRIVKDTISLKNGFSLGLERTINPIANNTDEPREMVNRWANVYRGMQGVNATVPTQVENNTFTPDNGEAYNRYNNNENVTVLSYVGNNNAPEPDFDSIKRESKFRYNKKEE